MVTSLSFVIAAFLTFQGTDSPSIKPAGDPAKRAQVAGDLELRLDKDVRYRSKAKPEWQPVPLAGVSKLLADGQTFVIHVNPDLDYSLVKELILMTSQRKDITVKVASLAGAAAGDTKEISRDKSDGEPKVGNELELKLDKDVRYRTKAKPEWQPVPLAGVSKLLTDGQTVVIHVNPDLDPNLVKELILMTSQRKEITVKVASLPRAAAGDTDSKPND